MSDALKKEKVKVDKAWLAYLEAAEEAKKAYAKAGMDTAKVYKAAAKAYATYKAAAKAYMEADKAYLSTGN